MLKMPDKSPTPSGSKNQVGALEVPDFDQNTHRPGAADTMGENVTEALISNKT